MRPPTHPFQGEIVSVHDASREESELFSGIGFLMPSNMLNAEAGTGFKTKEDHAGRGGFEHEVSATEKKALNKEILSVESLTKPLSSDPKNVPPTTPNALSPQGPTFIHGDTRVVAHASTIGQEAGLEKVKPLQEPVVVPNLHLTKLEGGVPSPDKTVNGGSREEVKSKSWARRRYCCI